MPRILIVSAVFPPEPVVSAKLSYDIASSLSLENSVTVISPKPSRPYGFQFSKESKPVNFKHIHAKSFVYPRSGLLGRFKESYSFGKYCYNYIAIHYQEIDIIYANTWPLFGQYFVVKAARRFGIPLIIHVQDIYPESLSKKLPLASALLNGILLPLDKYILRNANKVIAISHKMKQYLIRSRKLEQNNVLVVPNWQDEDSFINDQRQEKELKRKPFTFMYLGNIGPVAGVDLLLKAFVAAKLENARLIIAGSGSMKESLVKEAESISDSIVEFWPVPEGKVPEVQSFSEVLMLPVKKGNAFYSIPSKLPAYMFSGKPIIACVDKESDTATAIIKANCGYVVEPENERLLAQKMIEVYNTERSKLEEMGNNGRGYALLNFSKGVNLKKLVSVIESVI